MPDRYSVPEKDHRAETIQKKSRFIACVSRVRSPDEARAFVERIRHEFPDARHHCWAYVAGPPGSSHPCGMSDDGEPHGTAGKPMLQVLLNCGIGEIIAVVTRYFGGTKLGTGGLVRAYTGAVQEALDSLPVTVAVHTRPIRLRVGFEYEQALRHQLDQLDLFISGAEYGTQVTLQLEIAVDELDAAEQHLKGTLPHGVLEWILVE